MPGAGFDPQVNAHVPDRMQGFRSEILSPIDGQSVSGVLAVPPGDATAEHRLASNSADNISHRRGGSQVEPKIVPLGGTPELKANPAGV